jgi:orotate phosphoribosyltransferase-like protein
MTKKELLKDKVLELHYQGLSNKEICNRLEMSSTTVCVLIKYYTKGNDVKEGCFNVDEHECWIFPATKEKF